MRENLTCRFLSHAALASAAAPGPFALPGARTNRAPDRSLQVRHMAIEITPDLEAGTIEAKCTLTVLAVSPRRALALDAVALDVREVRDADGRALSYTNDGGKLRIDFAAELPAGAETTVSVHYAAKPRRGLYFIKPDRSYPDKPRQMWSQCQDEDARHWFPCPDAPNHRATTEIRCTVPSGLFCLSNGDLVERRAGERPDTEVFHWKQDFPHPPYLVTLVVGDFDEDHEEWAGVKVDFYFPRGRRDDARRTFENTVDILRFFSEYTGVKYPYSKYAQVIVADFIFGGMENTSATTLTERTLHDARAHVDYDSDGLVAHEAAHQWFGDLVTCRTWSHGWLNEGFATYFDALYHEHHRGKDELDFYMDEMSDEYFEEASRTYRRPIVCEQYIDPIELFDRHLYQKGGLVLHMLRHELGEAPWRASLKNYLERHRGRSVETVDLVRAIEDTTGRNLDAFFEQWVRRAGHPELDVTYSWDAERKEAELAVRQTQEVGTDGTLYRLSLPVRFVMKGGKNVDGKIDVADAQGAVRFALAEEPLDVVIDPSNVTLKKMTVNKPTSMWKRGLATAPEAIARGRAAAALGHKHDPGVVSALSNALLSDVFWGTQAAAARALGALGTDEARDALLDAAAKVAHPKARRAVVEALGRFRRDGRAGEALARIAEDGDASYFVEYEAFRALGKGRHEGAFERLLRLRDRAGWWDLPRRGALEGLAALRDERGIAPALADAAYGRPKWARPTALRAAGTLGEGKRAVAEEVAELLDDPDLAVRMAAIAALEEIGHDAGVGKLDEHLERELDGRARRQVRQALRGLREGHGRDSKLGALRDQIDQLQEETRQLRDRVGHLERKVERP